MQLSAQPTSNVVVRVTVSGSSDVAVDTDGSTDGDQDTLTFTNGNWDTGQLVRVRAADDADAVDDAASIPIASWTPTAPTSSTPRPTPCGA